MDIRPSLPLRSPLARLNSNRQRDQDEIDTTLFSPGGGTTTCAGSRKLRKLFERLEEDEPRNTIHIASSSTFATSSSGGADSRTNSSGSGSGSDSKTNTWENRIERKKKAVPKKIKSKSKSKSKSKLPKKRTSIGRWEIWERFEFLRGLRCHGKGHWKKIGERIPSRCVLCAVRSIVSFFIVVNVFLSSSLQIWRLLFLVAQLIISLSISLYSSFFQ